PRGYLMRSKRAFGFQTGDMVRADVPSGKKVGRHIGRLAIRATGSFNIQTVDGVVQGVSHRYCKIIQRGDGYGYSLVAQSTKESGHRGDASRRALSLTGLKADVSRAN
ncbi:HNH endonuclease, partial [Cupriavidus sp. CuC1]